MTIRRRRPCSASDSIVACLARARGGQAPVTRGRPGERPRLGRRRRPAERPGAAVEPLPTDRRRPRHHDGQHRQRRRRPARPPRPARSAAGRPRPDAGRRGGAPALLGPRSPRHIPDDDRAPHRWTTPRSPAANRSWSASPPPTTIPRPTPTRRSSTSTDRPERTSRSATASTSASAPPWPGSRPGSPWPRCSVDSRTFAWPCRASELEWAHGDGLVLRGLDALPVTLGDQPAPSAA